MDALLPDSVPSPIAILYQSFKGAAEVSVKQGKIFMKGLQS